MLNTILHFAHCGFSSLIDIRSHYFTICFLFFLLIFFWRTEVLFLGPLMPLFWTPGYVCPGFQSQGRSFACFFACVILRFTSSAAPTDCIEVSMAAEPFLIYILADVSTSIGGGLGLKPTTICVVNIVLYTIQPLWLSSFFHYLCLCASDFILLKFKDK